MRGTNNRTADATPIRLRVDRLRAEANTRGWTTNRDIANGLGVHEASIGRLLSTGSDGKPLQTPGPPFIAAVMKTFGAKFEDYFELTDDGEPTRMAS